MTIKLIRKKMGENKHPPPKYKTNPILNMSWINEKRMSTNCLNTLGNGRYQPIKFALSRPTAGYNLKNPSHP
jgi:hypothetical protein